MARYFDVTCGFDDSRKNAGEICKNLFETIRDYFKPVAVEFESFEGDRKYARDAAFFKKTEFVSTDDHNGFLRWNGTTAEELLSGPLTYLHPPLGLKAYGIVHIYCFEKAGQIVRDWLLDETTIEQLPYGNPILEVGVRYRKRTDSSPVTLTVSFLSYSDIWLNKARDGYWARVADLNLKELQENVMHFCQKNSAALEYVSITTEKSPYFDERERLLDQFKDVPKLVLW